MVDHGLILGAAIRGLRVRLDADCLVVHGPREHERLAREILDRKDEVAALLRSHPELADLDRFTAEAMLTLRCELVPEGEWPAWEVCLPLEQVIAELEGTATWDPLQRPCQCCGGSTWWRLQATSRAAGGWVCQKCHPAIAQLEAIEVVTIAEFSQ